MRFIDELNNLNGSSDYFTEDDLNYFSFCFKEDIKKKNDIYLQQKRKNGTNSLMKYSCGYYGKDRPYMYDEHKTSTFGGLCYPEFQQETHNGCRVLDAKRYRGPVFPFPNRESAELCSLKIDKLLTDLGFEKKEVRIEKVYFSYTHFKGGTFFKKAVVKDYDREPSYIIFIYVEW